MGYHIDPVFKMRTINSKREDHFQHFTSLICLRHLIVVMGLVSMFASVQAYM